MIDDRLIKRLETLSPQHEVSHDIIHKWVTKIKLANLLHTNEARPFTREISGKAARREIAEYHDLCNRLYLHVSSMSKTATDALKREKQKEVDPIALGYLLRDHVHLSERAHNSIDEEKPGNKGANRRVHAPKVTDNLCLAFTEICGKQPTLIVDPVTSEASGRFLDLVHDIFEILGIGASPESQARDAIKRFNLRKTGD